MKSLSLIVLVLLSVFSFASAQDTDTNDSNLCITPVQPGEEGLLLWDFSLQAKPSWSSDSLAEMAEGDTFTVLEEPVCVVESEVWVKIEYQEQQGWLIITQYGLCEQCPYDTPGFSAERRRKVLVPVAASGDDPRLAPSLIAPSYEAVTPETVSALTQLRAFEEGKLQTIRWLEDGSLSVTTSVDQRVYDPHDLSQPLSTVTFEQPIPTTIQNRWGSLIAFIDYYARPTQLSLLDEDTGRLLTTLEGTEAVLDATGTRLAIVNDSYASVVHLYDTHDMTQPQLIKTFTDVGTPVMFKEQWLITHKEGYFYTVDLETDEMTVFYGGFGTMNFTDGFVLTTPSPDQEWLATVYNVSFAELGYRSDDYTFQLYNVHDLPPSSVWTYAIVSEPIPNPEREKIWIDLEWSADSHHVIVATQQTQSVYTFDPQEGLLNPDIFTIPGVVATALNADGSLTAFATSTGEVLLYRGTEQVATLLTKAAATRLSFSPDGQTLAVFASEISLWNMTTFEKDDTLSLAPFLSFKISPDGKSVQTGTRRYDLATGQLIEVLPVSEAGPTTTPTPTESIARIDAAVKGSLETADRKQISPNAQLMAVVGSWQPQRPDDEPLSMRLLIFDAETSDLLNNVMLQEDYDTAEQILFSADGKKILIGFFGSAPVIYDLATETVTALPLPEGSRPDYVALNYDGTLAFVSDLNGDLTVWNTTTGAQIDVPVLTDSQGIIKVEMSADGSRLYTLDRYGRFFVWGLPESITEDVE